MDITRVALAWTLVMLFLTHTSTAIDPITVISVASSVIGFVSFVQTLIQDPMNEAKEKEKFKTILKRFSRVDNKLDELQSGVEEGTGNILDFLQVMSRRDKWLIQLQTLENYIRDVNVPYRKLLVYQQQKQNIEKHTLEDFATNVLSHSSSSVDSTMGKIFEMVAPDAPLIPEVSRHRRQGNNLKSKSELTSHSTECPHEPFLLNNQLKKCEPANRTTRRVRSPSIYETLYDLIKVSYDCKSFKTPQQIIAELYSLISLTLVRGYAVINFAYLIQTVSRKGNFTTEYASSKADFEHFTYHSSDEASKNMKKLKNSFSACYPSTHREGSTYVMFTEFLQGHIQNEVDMHSRVGSCWSECSYYQNAEPNGRCRETVFCRNTRKCEGRIRDCRKIWHDGVVCPSNSRNRRYEWLKYHNGALHGEDKYCSRTVEFKDWHRWFRLCSFCACLCDDRSSSRTDRYVSLVPSVSDVENNYVMTGIKFIKRNRIIMLQIQEGKAIRAGKVDDNTVKWKDAPSLRTSSSNIDELTYDSRRMNLQDLKAPRGYVLTGVKFEKIEDRLALKVQVTKISLKTGKLKSKTQRWISGSNIYTELYLSNKKNPAKYQTSRGVNIRNGRFVTFQPTSWESDLSQNTVPYFDAQPVYIKPPKWITGLNLQHRGTYDTGGFLFLEASYYNNTKNRKIPS